MRDPNQCTNITGGDNLSKWATPVSGMLNLLSPFSLSFYLNWPPPMDEATIKTQYPKCLLYWCLIEFIDWRNSQSCLVFSTPLVSCCPSTFSLTSSTPPLLLKVNVNYGKTRFLTRLRTYKIATPAQTKTPVKTTFRDWCLYSYFVHASSTPAIGSSRTLTVLVPCNFLSLAWVTCDTVQASCLDLSIGHIILISTLRCCQLADFSAA